MHVTVKRGRITSISGTIQTNEGDARCKFFPTTKSLFIFGEYGGRRATPDEMQAFRFEFFGRKSEVLDELDRQTTKGEVRTGTRVKASRLVKATPLVESVFC
ncbi:MAG: hypothetical protein ABH842_03880 [Candidatus Micrarchaeota archaeon]